MQMKNYFPFLEWLKNFRYNEKTPSKNLSLLFGITQPRFRFSIPVPFVFLIMGSFAGSKVAGA
jgi:hypothetical protein